MTVFLSYSRSDKAKVSAIYDLLRADDYDVFMDTDIGRGSDFRKRISVELQRAKCVVGFWSESSVNSQWVIDEADYARLHGRLVPVLLDNSLPPIGFGNLNAAALREFPIEKDSSEYSKLREAIDAVIKGEFETELPLRKGLDKILNPLPSKDYREFKTQQGDLNTSVAEAVDRLVSIQRAQTKLLDAQTAKIQASTKRWEVIVYPSLFIFVILVAYMFFLVYTLAFDVHVIAEGATEISDNANAITDSMTSMRKDMQSIAVGMEVLSREAGR